MRTSLCDPCLAEGVLRPSPFRYGYRGEARIDVCADHAAAIRADRRVVPRVWTAEFVRGIAERASHKAAEMSGRAAPEARTPTVATVSDLAAFKSLATELGASLRDFDRLPDPAGVTRTAFRAWASDRKGGCGEPGCGCSPGLWVSATESDRPGVTAHFGTGWQRGGDAYWTDADASKWRRLALASGAVA